METLAARYASLDCQTSLQPSTLKRAEYLRLLRGLKPAARARAATIGNHTHAVFGEVRRTALHEREHGAQLEAFLRGG